MAGKSGECPELNGHECGSCAGLGVVHGRIGYVNSFQTEFYNKMYSSFDSNIFYASAIIIFAAKLISCVFDPLIGAMIDKSSLKGGKMRPWVLRSALPLAVLTTLIFIYIPFADFLIQSVPKSI